MHSRLVWAKTEKYKFSFLLCAGPLLRDFSPQQQCYSVPIILLDGPIRNSISCCIIKCLFRFDIMKILLERTLEKCEASNFFLSETSLKPRPSGRLDGLLFGWSVGRLVCLSLFTLRAGSFSLLCSHWSTCITHMTNAREPVEKNWQIQILWISKLIPELVHKS